MGAAHTSNDEIQQDDDLRGCDVEWSGVQWSENDGGLVRKKRVCYVSEVGAGKGNGAQEVVEQAVVMQRQEVGTTSSR